MNAQDSLYATARQVVEQFQFDERVAEVFSDMVKRSVPGYTLMLDMLGVIAEKWIKDESLIYDLGCSLGASTLAIRQNIQAQHVRILAVDNSAAMLAQCQKVINQDISPPPVELIEANIEALDFEPCDFVALNLTLQFIPLEERALLLSRLFKALKPGGVLFLSEKVIFDDTAQQTLLTDLHHQFKQHQGYSLMEIAQKRQAIEDFLVPETIQAHLDRLDTLGFSSSQVIFQCLNFCTFLAIK